MDGHHRSSFRAPPVLKSCETVRHIEKPLTVFWSIPVNLFEKLWACASGVSFTRTNHVSHSVHDFSEDPISKTTLVKVRMRASCIHPNVFWASFISILPSLLFVIHYLICLLDPIEKTVPILESVLHFLVVVVKECFLHSWLLLSTRVLFHCLLF